MDDDRSRVLALLKRHGWNATSFQILEAGFRYWFDPEGDACVAYVETRGAWVVAGAPVAAPERIGAVAHAFVAHARAHGRRCSFFAAEPRLVEAAALPALRIGEQPVWDPARWAGTVAGSRTLREQLRRARNKGVEVRELAPAELDAGAPMRAAVEALIQRWLHARVMAPMGFLVDVQPFSFAAERRYFVAVREGAVVGFLAAVPVYARGGWLFEDFIRDRVAPNGTAELLVDAGMRSAGAAGSRYVTLGLAPLAGDVGGWLRAVRRWSAALYDFSGLHAFKAKLRPDTWEPIFLAHPPGTSGNAALYDALAAFARGSFVRFGGETLLRGPAGVVRLLAALLVPWTVLLALAPARWFPSPAVRAAWVGFDVLLVVALFALTFRWRAWLGTLLAGAITIDALLTAMQIFVWDFPRGRSTGDWLIYAIAIAGPTVAALVLWGAVGHHAREPG